MPPLAILGGLALGGSIIGAVGANKAAGTQADAANNAAQLQHQDAQAALQFQQKQYDTSQANLAPWLSAGRGGLVNLANLLGVPMSGDIPGTTASGGSASPNPAAGATSRISSGSVGLARLAGLRDNGPGSELRYANENGVPTILNRGATATQPLSSLINPALGATGSLSQPFSEKFTAPTDVTEQNDPGYKFRLSQGLEALQNSAAARGNLLSGNTAKAINDYAQNSASSEYGNVYNRSLGEYQQRFNQFQIGQSNTYNRLAALSGIGQTTAGQLSSAGQAASNNIGNILLTSGQQIGNNINNAGAARASGYVGTTNALTGGINNLSQLAMLNQLYGGGNGLGSLSSITQNDGTLPFINP